MTHLLYDGVRCTLLGTLLTLLTLSAAAQSWRVTVLDAEDRQPLPGVILRLGRHTYLTDGAGLALVPTDAGQRGIGSSAASSAMIPSRFRWRT